METLTNGFRLTHLTKKKIKNPCLKKLKNNHIENNIERNVKADRLGSNARIDFKMNKRMMSGQKSILSVILSLLYLFVAPVIQVLPVYGEAAEVISVWEVMETQLVGANSIITDQAVVSAYSSTLGNIAAETASAEVINIGLSNAAAECGVELAPLFANTAESAAAVGINATAASAGENIAASCAAASTGSVVLPAIGGAVVVAGAATITAGLVHLCRALNEQYRASVNLNAKLTTLNKVQSLPARPSGTQSICFLSSNTGERSFACQSFAYIWSGGTTGTINIYAVNPTNSSVRWYRADNGAWSYMNNVARYSYDNVLTWQGETFKNLTIAGAVQVNDIKAYVRGFQYDGKHVIQPYSPDIASISGPLIWNPAAIPENDPDIIIPNIPELRPLPDYANDYGLAPLPEAAYNDIVTYINNLPKPKYLDEQEEQKESTPTVIRPIIDPYIIPIGDPIPNPNPDPDPNPTETPDPNPTGTPDPNPTGTPDPDPNPNPKPDTQPFPDPETVPQPTPVVNPTPDSDVAPAPVPYPDPETPTEQDKTYTDAKITPIDLRDKFPFCIPFDIVKIMKLFQGGREAPCFTWEIPFGQAGSGSVTVDLSPWDSAATLLRTLELILFIMLLAVGTRNLIGGSG